MEKKLMDVLLRREEGQTMVEYSIVAALIAVVAMVAVQALGDGITGVFNNIVQSITSV
jgi:pilus assembly protein Flp/PilA